MVPPVQLTGQFQTGRARLLGVDAALRLCATVLVLQILEAAAALATVGEPVLKGNLLRGLHVTEAGESYVMKRVVRHFVLAEVAPAVLKGPEGKRVDLERLPDRKRGTLGAVVAAAAVDPGVSLGLLERTLEGLDLAKAVVLIDVRHPRVLAILLPVLLGGVAIGAVVHGGLEAVVSLDFLEEVQRLGEEVEGIDEDDLNLVEIAGLGDGVQDNTVAGNERGREHRLLLVRDERIQGGLELGFERL
mmetsp:Transcript_5479/g.21666  ORF Transcript_5479/g.21666 Transcript_5479/m.21666 type:complete len:246 (+) Transcript_5479:1884-2621(+)